MTRSWNTPPRGAPGGGECGCCGGPVTVRIINVGGVQVGINRLDQILKVVKAVGLQDPVLIKQRLLLLVKASNYVPPGMDDVYAEALWQEYLKLR